ncbi:MAG: hypothetical protein SWK76_06525 [Actinomycetota bacterium]|nr:hypothetical protein [Actinomycetota bacterium]
MGYVRTRTLIALATFALFAGVCLMPSLVSISGSTGQALGQDTGCDILATYSQCVVEMFKEVGGEAVTVEEARVEPKAPVAMVTAPIPTAPVPQPVADVPVEVEEPDEGTKPEDVPPDDFAVSAVNPDRPVPSNLNADYRYGWFYRVILTWDGVDDPDFLRYYILRWTGDDFEAMVGVFQQLAEIEPSAQPYVDDLWYQAELLGQPGLTDAERRDFLEDVQSDITNLFAIMVATPGSGDPLNQLVSLADVGNTTSTRYTDWNIEYSQHYMYVVAAAFGGGDTSAPSNCETIYTVYVDTNSPAQPKGFTATAYDPGVGLEWSRNTEEDLAGYNVYLVDGGSPVVLNSELIEFGTTFFHDAGLADATYQVVAVDIAGYSSSPASATSVLVPATIYEDDDPAWQLAGLWVTENYVESGGDELLVAEDAGSTASISFNGRRVKIFTASYWTCGDMRVYVDSEDMGLHELYSAETLWAVEAFVVTGLDDGTHTLSIEVAGTGGADGYNFVNFDYVEAR